MSSLSGSPSYFLVCYAVFPWKSVWIKGGVLNVLMLYSLHPGDPAIQVQMWSDTVDEGPRYTFTIVDLHKRVRAKNGPFAIFIVPHGR